MNPSTSVFLFAVLVLLPGLLTFSPGLPYNPPAEGKTIFPMVQQISLLSNFLTISASCPNGNLRRTGDSCRCSQGRMVCVPNPMACKCPSGYYWFPFEVDCIPRAICSVRTEGLEIIPYYKDKL